MSLILGCGTGRCGTQTLSTILNAQPGAIVFHELRYINYEDPDTDYGNIVSRLRRIGRSDSQIVYTGDVGFYWIWHAEKAIKKHDAKMVCLEREKNDTVASIFRQNGNKNNFSVNLSDGECRGGASIGVPKYFGSREEATNSYWIHHHMEAGFLQKKYPDNFRIFRTETLSTENTQREILEFCMPGHPQPVCLPNVVQNQSIL